MFKNILKISSSLLLFGLIAVQSFLHVSTEPHHWLVSAFDWCEGNSKNGKINAIDLVKALEDIDNNLIHDETRRLSPIQTLNTMRYDKAISYYWFYRLDYELLKLYWNENKHSDLWCNIRNAGSDDVVRKLIRDFRFRQCGSVEHIKPQHKMEGNPDIPADHSFGNLALISASRNSKFSNVHPDGKKGIILETQSPYTESLKMAHFLWLNQNIEQEGEMMHEILHKSVKDFLPSR